MLHVQKVRADLVCASDVTRLETAIQKSQSPFQVILDSAHAHGPVGEVHRHVGLCVCATRTAPSEGDGKTRVDGTCGEYDDVVL